MTDLASTIGTDRHPDTLEPSTTGPAPAPPLEPASDLNTHLPAGVHPRDRSAQITAPTAPGIDTVPGEGHLGPQGERRRPPWNTDNEQALPTFERASHDWLAREFTLSSSSGPVQLAGRLRGCKSTTVWVPATSANGVMISPDEGDVQQGAAITLNPGDAITLPTEAAVWGGVITGNSTGGPVQVVRVYDPPGGGLGLSSV